MLLIGIAGANALVREQVAALMAASGVCVVSRYSDPLKGRFCSPREHGHRMERLNEMISATPAKGARCLVVTHVMQEAEAVRIRELGGFMAHCEGVPSNEVVIRRGDLLVTDIKGGYRHFIDAAEALSELWVREQRGGAA